MSSDQVLLPQQIAARVDRAVLRAARILSDIRQDPHLYLEVAPQLTVGGVERLAEEVQAFLELGTPTR